MGIKLDSIKDLENKCVDIRENLLNFIYRIGMGHLGGELSMVEMAVALYYKYLNFDVLDPHKEGRDRFILSKGHCSETLYTIFSGRELIHRITWLSISKTLISTNSVCTPTEKNVLR